jgi:hypothetical protein
MEGDARRAHRTAAVVAVLGIFGTAVSFLGWRDVPAYPLRYFQYLELAVCGVVLVVLWVRRSSPSKRLGNALFLAVIIPVVCVDWVGDVERARKGGCFVPYGPKKLAALTVGALAPPGLVTGVSAIALLIGSALVHHQLFPAEVRQNMTAGEPWATVLYGGFALALLVYRLRARALREAMAWAEAERLALRRVSRLALSLRDLANTPIQTLELISRLLASEGPRSQVLRARMERSLKRLRRLNAILQRHQDVVPWEPGQESFDPETLMDERERPK